jgi:hypothetical protein
VGRCRPGVASSATPGWKAGHDERPSSVRGRLEQLTNRAARRTGDRARGRDQHGIFEALSDTGEQTSRGSGLIRGAITGVATTLGGLFHSLQLHAASRGEAVAKARRLALIDPT